MQENILVLTDKDDFVSNQIQFLSLQKAIEIFIEALKEIIKIK
jgi:hypothetical protein